jgi:rhomboid family GlyGly-CTERM serine protease
VTKRDFSRDWRAFSGIYGAPAAIGLLAALLELGGEPLRLALRYDRDALAANELWRLVTGHLVHLGPSHMVMNVFALGVLAVIFGRLLRAIDWIVVGFAAALAIDGGLFWLSTDVGWYVGLSGVLHGFWAAACVFAIAERRREAIALTLLILVKLGFEASIGPVALTGEIAGGPVVTVAHAYGATGGTIAALGLIAIRLRARSI